ncbi:hypothetical protein SKAU_G00094440 [Synaphobranchus kaupii]|uniref:Secreted protein n=1 Tax=Synaphobranchus kaupii TaxID=118154 RepID=A0A9Q1FXC8_SYNKA|nr:hypothetical protein SKAU_G00094440 [Synaphobranchus kaupii]
MTGLLGPALAVMNLPSLSLVVKLAAEGRRRRTTTIFQDRSSPLSAATTTQVQLIKALKLNRFRIVQLQTRRGGGRWSICGPVVVGRSGSKSPGPFFSPSPSLV